MLKRNAQIQLTRLIGVIGVAIFGCLLPEPSGTLANNGSRELAAEVPITSGEFLFHPSRNDKPIFRYAVSGGVRGANKPIDKLLIFDNGNILVTGDVGVPDREAKLTAEDLQVFKDFILKKNTFFSLDSADIEKRMNQNGATAIADGYSSIFSGNFDGKVHEVEIYSLWAATKSFPNFEEIKKCEAIEKRCKAIISVVNLGDRGPKILAAVNAEIAKKKLEIQPFKLSEMRLASQSPGGRFQVSFSRVLAGNTDNPPKAMHAIYFVKQTGANPLISFYNLPKK